MESINQSSRTKIVFLGGGASGAKFLQTAAKLPDAIKDQLDIVLIDAKNYMEAPIAMQRYLVQPEKAKAHSLPVTDALRAIGIGRFVQGNIAKVSKGDQVVHLADGTKISYDFCVVGTGESYNNHPWLNETMRASLDTSDSSPLAALKSDLKRTEKQAYATFVELSGMRGVDIHIVRDFASQHEDAELFKLACLLRGRKMDLDAVQALRDASKKVAKFLKKANVKTDVGSSANELFDSLSQLLRGPTRLWASRGQIRENVSDGVLRFRDWRIEQLTSESKSLEDAGSILVVGGGVIAVEAASDLADRFPGKKIAIMHRGKTLLDRLGSGRAQRYVTSFFQKRGVELILNESIAAWRIVGSRYAVLTRNSGEILEFNKVIVCYGGVPNTHFMQADFANHLDAHGRIHVDNCLRIEDNVFAMGDATDAYIKRVPAAWDQAEVTVKNIVNVLNGKPLEPYKKGSTAGLLTLGSTVTLFLIAGWCVMANRLGFSIKAKLEKTGMLEVGQTWGYEIDWYKQFEELGADYAKKHDAVRD